MALEGVEPRRPQAAVRSEPFVERPEWLGSNPVDAPLSVRPHVNKPCFAERPQVLRRGWLAERGRLRELADGPLGLEQQVEDLASVRLGEGCECWRHWVK
jgi:hypothetical protein